MTDFLMNRLANCTNPWQGKIKKVLCVCSAGLLRSPTAAWVLGQEPYNFNTRAVGYSKEFALISVDEVHLAWADEVVVMDANMEQHVKLLMPTSVNLESSKPIINLDIDDSYAYRDPELIELIREGYEKGQARLALRNSG
jgi:predicted protein tyrosine phosphatase